MTGTSREFAVIEAGRARNLSTRLMLGRYFADIVSDPGHAVCHGWCNGRARRKYCA